MSGKADIATPQAGAYLQPLRKGLFVELVGTRHTDLRRFYPQNVAGVPRPAPSGSCPEPSEPFARRFNPNWFVPLLDTSTELMAGIVFIPDVRVVPLTVTEYPKSAFVEISNFV